MKLSKPFPSCATRAIAFIVALAAGSVAAAEPIDFARDVAPIFQDHCIRCHQPTNNQGGLSLATVDDLADNEYVAAGEPEDSLLLEAITPSAPDEPPSMPQEGEPLSDAQIALIRQWIAQGASWPKDLTITEKSKADTSWWSLRPLADVEPPATDEIPAAWAANPIDRFVHARLTEKGLAPSPPADRRNFIRRAKYDLLGLPPTPNEVEAFVADKSPDAYEKLVDRLLQSPHYGERWGRHWLDVIRFGESIGFERNVIVDNAWPFRDYVIGSLNEDKPFDRLVIEHLAGDVIGAGNPDVEVGTTFLVCGPYDDVGNQDAVQATQIRANTIDEMIRAAGESFLGLTVGCARCHNHKFDPISQQDYYSLYATLAGVQHGHREIATETARAERTEQLRPLQEARQKPVKQKHDLQQAILRRVRARSEDSKPTYARPAVKRTGTEETFGPVRAKHVRLSVDGVDTNPRSRGGYRIDEFEVWTAENTPRNIALATNGGSAEGRSRVADDFDGAYGADLAIDGQFGACWIAEGPELIITLARPETIGRVVFSSDRTGAAGSHGIAAFVTDYRVEVSLDGQKWSPVADSYDRHPLSKAHERERLQQQEMSDEERRLLKNLERQIADLDAQIASVPPLPVWWVGNFQQPKESRHVFVGGDPQKKGDAVVPASLSALEQVATPYRLGNETAEGQRRLALAEWIVAEDNPLTARVLANRIWHYHFGTGIVDTPSDFGYMGGKPTHPQLLDWLARQVHKNGWRLKPLHRQLMLSQTYRQSSAFRSGAAAVDADSRYLWRFPPRRLSGGEIRDTMLAIADKLELHQSGPGFRLYQYMQDNVATYVPLDQHGPETYRRSIYHQNARASCVDLMTEFDCPDCAMSAPRRASTTTPLQALTLMNHSFTSDMARFLAERLQREADEDGVESQVQRAFALALVRPANDGELTAATRLIGAHGLPAFCRALLNSNEVIYLD